MLNPYSSRRRHQQHVFTQAVSLCQQTSDMANYSHAKTKTESPLYRMPSDIESINLTYGSPKPSSSKEKESFSNISVTSQPEIAVSHSEKKKRQDEDLIGLGSHFINGMLHLSIYPATIV
jgi:hypothetical protein